MLLRLDREYRIVRITCQQSLEGTELRDVLDACVLTTHAKDADEVGDIGGFRFVTRDSGIVAMVWCLVNY